MFPVQNCPLPTALTAITTDECQFNFDQIVRIAFQRVQASAPFADETAIKTLSNWTTLKAAADATKVVVSPAIAGFTIPQSETQSTGGNDNSTVKGLREVHGVSTVVANGMFKGLNPTILAELDNLTQFSLPNSVGNTNLTAYFISKDGYIFYKNGFFGKEIFNVVIGTSGTEGLNSKNSTPLELELAQYWDRDMKVVKPDFDPLTAI